MKEGTELIEGDWPYVLSLLPADLEESAKKYKALQRRREIKSAQDLLRLGLAYSICELSLRQTSSWSHQEGIAVMSNVAVLKRLKAGANWFGHLLQEKLAERTNLPTGTRLKIRLIDATTITQEGSHKVDWRVHLGFDLGENRMQAIELTDGSVGESLAHFQIHPGETLIADRGYVSVQEVHRVIQAQGHIILRLPPTRHALYTDEGSRIDLPGLLRTLEPGQVLDIPMQLGRGEKASSGRLIAIPKIAEIADQSREKVRRKAQKNGLTVNPEALEMAGYFFVFTSLPACQVTAEQILQLYRFRWQVELNFKRLKTLLALDEMTAKDPLLCRTFLTLKLLVGLLVEDLSERFRSFSPWGYGEKRLVVLAALPKLL